MTRPGPIEPALAELTAATETLLAQLQRRDPAYLESLHRRQSALERLCALCPDAEAPPTARAALERIRQLGEACQREAHRMREEILAALAELQQHISYAESLRRLAAPGEPSLLDVKG